MNDDAALAEAIRELTGSHVVTAMSAPARSRVGSVLTSLASACSARGYRLVLDTGRGLRFQIVTPAVSCSFVLVEEKARVVVPARDVDQATRYAWQRVPMREASEPSGRLKMTMDSYPRMSWADRRRWTLESKVPEILEAVCARADNAQSRRDAEEVAYRSRLAAWEDARTVAHRAATFARRTQLAIDQAERWAQARNLRAFADAVLDEAGRSIPNRDDARQSAADAVEWLRQVADGLDPLTSSEPAAVSATFAFTDADLDAHMPDGLAATRPPAAPK